MKLSIIPADGVIVIDGRSLRCSFSAPNGIHAIQWSGSDGVIEYATGPAEAFNDFQIVAPYIAAWESQRDVEDAPPPPPTADQIKTALVSAVQRHLDTEAKTRGYDGILSLASYASSTHPPFSAEGKAGLDWRDAVWSYCYQVLADVQAQTRPIPTEAKLIAELPKMVWP
jgi:hypothetical protein